MKLDRVLEFNVPGHLDSWEEEEEACSIDSTKTCEEIVGDMILDVQFDMGINADGSLQSRGLYSNGVSGETCFAYHPELSQCFIDLRLSNPNFSTSRWGWTTSIPEPALGEPATSMTLQLICGAGQCNISSGEEIGTVTITYDGSTANVDYHVTRPGTALQETHVYVGGEILPRMVNGRWTVAPGQYGNQNTSPAPTSDSYDILASGDIYLIAHAAT